jgi:hypothetical protein
VANDRLPLLLQQRDQPLLPLDQRVYAGCLSVEECCNRPLFGEWGKPHRYAPQFRRVDRRIPNSLRVVHDGIDELVRLNQSPQEPRIDILARPRDGKSGRYD